MLVLAQMAALAPEMAFVSVFPNLFSRQSSFSCLDLVRLEGEGALVSAFLQAASLMLLARLAREKEGGRAKEAWGGGRRGRRRILEGGQVAVSVLTCRDHTSAEAQKIHTHERPTRTY